MSDAWGIVLTSGLTIIGGIIVLVIGQLVQRFFIEPAHGQAKVIGEITYSLIFYANVYARGGGEFSMIQRTVLDEVMDAFRRNASQLIAATNAVRAYAVVERLKFAPPRKDCMEAARLLIGLSNSISRPNMEENLERRGKIASLLRIKLD